MGASTYKWESTGIVAIATTTGNDPGNYSIGKTPHPGTNTTRETRYIDLTKTTATSAVQLRVMVLPAGAYVTRVQYIGTTGENLNLSLGDSAGAQVFFSAASQSTAAVQTVWTTGKYYSSADEVNMTWSNDASNGKGFIVVDYGILTSTGN